MSEYLTITGLEGTALASTQEARAKRNELLVLARKGNAIVSQESAEKAGAILREIKGFTRMVEDARKDVKAPVIDLGKKIDGLASELTGELESEATRISRLLGAYQAEQNRLIEQARREAWEKERLIREEADRKMREAEEHSRTQESLEKKQDKIEAQTAKAIVAVRNEALENIPAKPTGIATRSDIKFTVEDIQALYDAAPTLVILSPNNPAIKAVLKQNPNKTLPGVKHWVEQSSIVRG